MAIDTYVGIVESKLSSFAFLLLDDHDMLCEVLTCTPYLNILPFFTVLLYPSD